MKLPSFTRVIKESLPTDVQKWVDGLINPLNSFMLTVKNGLNKGLTVNDNLGGAIKTVNVANNTVEFSYTSSRPPKVILIGNWRDTTDATWTPTTGLCLSWSFSVGKTITCTFYGLNAAHTYTVTLLILED